MASGCVPTSQYLEMRSKYEEEAAKNRRLADENNRLRSQIEHDKGQLAAKDIDLKAMQDKLDYLRNARMWDRIPGTTLDPTGKILRLSHLTFRSGSADLTPGGKRVLEQVAAQLKTRGNVMLVVDGHTDSDPIRRSNNRSNWELSGKRAAAVVDYLVKAGAVSGKNAMLRGFSKYRPIAANDTRANKAKNRRVELLYIPLGKGGVPAAGGGTLK
jgi:chemotaxis protein MotB